MSGRRGCIFRVLASCVEVSTEGSAGSGGGGAVGWAAGWEIPILALSHCATRMGHSCGLVKPTHTCRAGNSAHTHTHTPAHTHDNTMNNTIICSHMNRKAVRNVRTNETSVSLPKSGPVLTFALMHHDRFTVNVASVQPRPSSTHSPHRAIGSGAHRRQVLVPLRHLPHCLVELLPVESRPGGHFSESVAEKKGMRQKINRNG